MEAVHYVAGEYATNESRGVGSVFLKPVVNAVVHMGKHGYIGFTPNYCKFDEEYICSNHYCKLL